MIFLIDIETSGLRAHLDLILEVAVLAVTEELEEVAHLVVTLEAGDMRTWDPWSVKVHGKSGLLQRCKDNGISLAEAEKQLSGFILAHRGEGDKRPQLGGSNFHFDRAFMRAQMPAFDELFHHGGHLDAAVLRQTLKMWRPDLPVWTPPEKAHEALADIRGTLGELRFYRELITKT